MGKDSSTRFPAVTVSTVLLDLLSHPIENLLRRWNWKSAVLSACVRGTLFFVANVGAGVPAALGAMSVESAFYVMVAGFYGAATEAFRRARPAWRATVTTMILMPTFNQAAEFALHWASGTKKLKTSVIASTCLSVISAVFNLFAMRRGVFIVGAERRSLLADFRQLPRVIFDFLVAALRALWQTLLRPNAD